MGMGEKRVVGHRAFRTVVYVGYKKLVTGNLVLARICNRGKNRWFMSNDIVGSLCVFKILQYCQLRYNKNKSLTYSKKYFCLNSKRIFPVFACWLTPLPTHGHHFFRRGGEEFFFICTWVKNGYRGGDVFANVPSYQNFSNEQNFANVAAYKGGRKPALNKTRRLWPFPVVEYEFQEWLEISAVKKRKAPSGGSMLFDSESLLKV